MVNPVVVEATRGALVKSAHRGAGAVVDADGRLVMAFGDSRSAGLSSLRRQGAPGFAACRKRRRGPPGSQRQGDCA